MVNDSAFLFKRLFLSHLEEKKEKYLINTKYIKPEKESKCTARYLRA
jgi:hypothetical protein